MQRETTADITELDKSELRNMIRSAGIVGLGGAAFPTFIKLNPAGHQISKLILNGAECEPYISCDDMLMRERPHEIVDGAKIMRHALNAEQVIIAIEDNKPEAIAALNALAGGYDLARSPGYTGNLPDRWRATVNQSFDGQGCSQPGPAAGSWDGRQ